MDLVDEVLASRGRGFSRLVSSAAARRAIANAWCRALEAAAREALRVDLSQTSCADIARRIRALKERKR